MKPKQFNTNIIFRTTTTLRDRFKQYCKDNNQNKELLKIGAIEDNKIKNEPIFKSQNRQSKDTK